MDLTPTLLGLVGFDTAALHLDGLNALQPLPADRRLYFSGWMQQGPAGFVHGDRKFVYSPDRDAVIQYDLQADPLELAGAELPEAEARRISEEIGAWRKSTIFRPEPSSEGNVELFGAWLWKSNGRVSRLKDVEAEWPHGRPCGSDALRCQAAPPRSR